MLTVFNSIRAYHGSRKMRHEYFPRSGIGAMVASLKIHKDMAQRQE